MSQLNNRFAALVSNSNNSNYSNNNKFLHQKNQRNPRNQRHNKFDRDNGQNRFQRRNEKKNKEMSIDLGEKSFPALIKSVEYSEEEKLSNPTREMSYIEKIKYFKELNEKKDPLPKGWIILSKNKDFKPFTKVNLDENPYYNPNISFRIVYDRYINREELNDLVGDISPYWNMDEEYEYDTRDNEENYEDDESYLSDDSEYDESYDNI